MRRFALVSCLCLLAGCGGSQQTDDRTDAQRAEHCRLPLPEFARDLERGAVESTSGASLPVGVAAGDHTVTVVGFCLPSSAFPNPAPTLDDGTTRYPIGGELQQTRDGWHNYYLYPAAQRSELTVRHSGRTISHVSLPEAEDHSCATTAASPFRVVDCGALVVLEWESPFRFDAAGVEALDIDLLDPAERDVPLNYYDLGHRAGPDGLVLRFATRRPAPRRMLLRGNFAYVRERGRVREVPLRIQTPIRLSR